MSRLSPPSVGAKKPSSISPEADSPLLDFDPNPPEFELPKPSSSPASDEFIVWSEPGDNDVPPLFRAAARRAHRELGPHLRGIQDEQIWIVGINRSCIEVGRACVAQGGLLRMQISLPDIVVKARMMQAAGILLLQNWPGPVVHGASLDALATIKVAVLCELIGIPLVDHLYINTDGHAFSMRERGILKKVPELLLPVREYASGLVVKAWQNGRCEDDYHQKKAAREAAKNRPAEEPMVYRKGRSPQKS